MTLIDHEVGRVLAALDELGLSESTACLFTADHGEFTGSHRLHDKGPAMYDDIYQVPMLARLPEDVHAPAARVRDEFVTLADMTPTFLDLAGRDIPQTYDGESLVPLLRGEESHQRSEVVAEFHGHHFPYPQRMIRTGRYKLVVNPPDKNELYDLVADPDEMHNRYDHPEFATVRQELLHRLHVILRERGDNFYHWMTSMFEVGEKSYDTSLSQLDSG